MLSALRSKFWRAYSESKGIREADIQFTDRYEALGIHHPDSETMCMGFCEGTGWIPVKMGKNGGRDGLATVEDETDPELVALWHQAEAANPSGDGWHFVKCPECNGTGKRLSEVFRVTAPGREPKTFQKRVDAEAYRDRYPGSKITKISEQGTEASKLTNERAKLRDADPNNKGERCGFCVFFDKPSICKIVEGPVTADLVCDWIQSRGLEGAIQYSVNDADWEAFVKGMIQDQPYQHIVRDGAMTPAGPMVLIEDTSEKPHRFSLTKEFHIGHTSLEHHWTQKEVDDLIVRGKSTKTTEIEPSGGHKHPHGQNGAHSHPGLPSGGGHDHNGDGSHRHRPGDPLEGAHGNTGQGYHEHPLALASMTEAKHEDLRKKIKEGLVVPSPIGRRLANGKATGSLWPRENKCFGMFMILVQDSRALGFIRHNATPQKLKRSEAGELKAQHSMSQAEIDRRFPKSDSLVLYKVAEFVPIPGSPVVTVDVPEDRIDPRVQFKEAVLYSAPELDDRCDFEVIAAVNWIRSEESAPIETVKWSEAERIQFKTEAMEEAGKRGLFSAPKK